MELREYDGCLVIDGREGETMRLRVALSSAGGVTTGAGSFPVPFALVGASDDTRVTFRTDAGARLTLLIREIDPAEGYAYFLTEGVVPEVEVRQKSAS